MAEYYPGLEYVDWVGVNTLNYANHDFKSLYEPYPIEINKLPQTPVILSEFGSRRDINILVLDVSFGFWNPSTS